MHTLVPNQKRMIVFLVGFMGSGKSFYAKGLANHLHVPMVDLDNYLEKKQGITISGIFEKFGEQSFRDMESLALKEVYSEMLNKMPQNKDQNRIVGIVSCGGGTPCFNENMEWMNHHGMTVWINPPEAVISERLKKEAATRPLLANLDEAALTDFIRERMADRIPFYAMASTTITDPHISMEEFLNAIQNAKNIF